MDALPRSLHDLLAAQDLEDPCENDRRAVAALQMDSDGRYQLVVQAQEV